MAFKEVKKFGELKKLENIGDTVEGYFKGKHQSETQFGQTDFLDFVSDDGEFSIVATSGLKTYDWDKLYGKKVRIEYVGNKKNEKTKRTFKDYKVMVDEEDTLLVEDMQELPF